MIEVKRDDFFVESIKNPIEYGTYYKINPKYGTGFQWTSEVHHDFIITVTDIRFNQETMVGEHIGSGYVLALYISGAGDEFYPYQNISPNTLRCYEPSEKYKAIYHPQIPLRCITVQVDQEFIDQYLQEISGDLEVNFSDFFKEKGKFYLPNVNHAMQSLYEYLLSMKASRITVEAKIYEIISYLASYLKENRLNEENGQPINKTDLQALAELTHYMDEHYSFNITLQTLSTIACMSESKMKKLFKLVYNKGDNKMYNAKLIELSNKTNIMYRGHQIYELKDVYFYVLQTEEEYIQWRYKNDIFWNMEHSEEFYNRLMNPMKIEILTNKKPKELKGKKKIATINKDADYKVQVFIDDDYNLYYQDNHAFASCESKIVDNKVETAWNSCKCWFKIIGLYECRNNHIVDILRDLNSYSEYLYPKNNVADNVMLSRLYEQMVNVYLDYVNN